jgi:RNA polymerase sigma-70 factor (ECF subfamily)
MIDREQLLDELRPLAFGIAYLDAQQGVIGVMALDVADGLITSVSAIANPDKLTHLGPVGDLAALMRAGTSR